MKNLFRAEFYKLGRNRLLWLCVVLSFSGTGIYYGLDGAKVFDIYKGLELFGLPGFTWLPYSFLVAITTGLSIGGDFSTGTIRNALAVGVTRRDYYFARLGAQMLLTAFGFGLGQLAYVICHVVRPWGNPVREISMLEAKLAIYANVTLLQLLAYVAIVNAVCYFVKKQVAAMVVGMVLIYIEAIVRQLAESGNLEVLMQIVRYLPVRILYSMFTFAAYDQVFTMDFLGFGISALVIIAVAGIVGYVKFEFYPGEI